MWHFIAKVGRNTWSKTIVPTAAVLGFGGYLGVHIAGHGLVTRFMSAQKPNGEREEISGKLQDIIISAYEDVRGQINQLPTNLVSLLTPKSPEMKWFISSTLEPITFGSLDAETGIIVGLPNYFNYEREEDLPQRIFEFKRVQLFKPSAEQRKEEKPEDQIEFEDVSSVKLLDRNSEDGQLYQQSLILSENAKKFAVARELFYSDTMRTYAMSFVISGSILISLLVSRGAVTKFGLAERHVTQRFPFYMLAGFFGWTHYAALSDIVNEYYSKKADHRACNVNELYREGAVEYFTKMIQRHKALRNMVDELRYSFDEEGNYIEPKLRPIPRKRRVPPTERLADAQEITTP